MVSRIYKKSIPIHLTHGNDNTFDSFDISLTEVNLKFKAVTFNWWIKTIEKGRKERENMQSYLEGKC